MTTDRFAASILSTMPVISCRARCCPETVTAAAVNNATVETTSAPVFSRETTMACTIGPLTTFGKLPVRRLRPGNKPNALCTIRASLLFSAGGPSDAVCNLEVKTVKPLKNL